eukprot:919186-Pleurochrysis_carterae.AAC.1
MEQLRCSQAFREAVALLRAAALPGVKDDKGRAGSATVGLQPRWRMVVQDVQEHMQQAEHIELPMEACPGEDGLDASVLAAVEKVARERGDIVAWRGRQLRILHRCAVLLLQENGRLLAAMSPGHLLAANQPTIHVALVEALTLALDLQDKGLAEALAHGHT